MYSCALSLTLWGNSRLSCPLAGTCFAFAMDPIIRDLSVRLNHEFQKQALDEIPFHDFWLFSRWPPPPPSRPPRSNLALPVCHLGLAFSMFCNVAFYRECRWGVNRAVAAEREEPRGSAGGSAEHRVSEVRVGRRGNLRPPFRDNAASFWTFRFGGAFR